MARNGSGTEVIPNTLVAGTPITASDHNENYADIASEITNSLALDGQSTMTGQFKASSGTVGAPGISFGSDTDTGFYRSASNELSGAVGATQAIKISSSGVDAPNGRILQGGVSLVPPGALMPYAGSSAPTGWLLCDGSVISQTTYADLYAAIGATYNTSGEGAGNFRLPDCGGRVLAGKEASASRLTTAGSGVDGGTLGATGGAQTVTLSQANLPNIAPTASGTQTLVHASSGATPITPNSGSGANVGSPGSGVYPYSAFLGIDNHTVNFSNATISSINGNVTQTAVNKVQPTLVLNFIIKT